MKKIAYDEDVEKIKIIMGKMSTIYKIRQYIHIRGRVERRMSANYCMK